MSASDWIPCACGCGELMVDVRHGRLRQYLHGHNRRRVKIDWDKQPLGKVRDADLAAQLGVSRETVRKARVAREVAAFGRWPSEEKT